MYLIYIVINDKQEISDKKTKIGEKGFIFLPYIIEGVCQTKIKEISK